MFTLHWIFINGHAWQKSFDSEKDAENHAHLIGVFKGQHIKHAFIETENETIWLKEKHDQF